MLEQGVRGHEAAAEVGCEGISQFSREFKLHYGLSPVKFIPARNARPQPQPSRDPWANNNDAPGIGNPESIA